jgi:putative aminopeptidase FrvX
VEMIHKDDVDNVIRLIYEMVLDIKKDQDFRSFSK